MKHLKSILIAIVASATLVSICHASENKIPLIWNLSQESKNIIDRGDFIDNIKKTLSETPQNQIGKFYLSGPSGIGKTYIARTYANNYRNQYDVVYFFNSNMSIIEQLKKFNFELTQIANNSENPTFNGINLENEEPEKILYYAREFFRTSKLKWLVIFDNINTDFNLEALIPDHTKSEMGHIIFTSQAHNIEEHAIPAPLPTEASSLNFLIKELSLRNDKKESIALLAKTLKNYPIALHQASSYLRKNTTITINEYLALLSIEENLNPLKISEKAILASVKNIQNTNPMAKQLLNMISCMHSKNIPGSLLKHWFINQQIGSYHDFTQAIDLAINYSLITPKNLNSDFFETHDFIQDTIYKSLTNEETTQLNKSLITALRAEFMQESKSIINPSFSEIIDHAKAAYERGMKENNTSDEFLSLLIDIFEHNNTYKRDFTSSSGYITQITPIFNAEYVKNREIKSRFYLTAARFYWRLGKMEQCGKYLANAEKVTLPTDIEEYNRLKIYQSDLNIEISNLKLMDKYLAELEKHSAKNGYAKKQGSSAYYYLMVLHHMTLADSFNLCGNFDAALRNIDLGIQKATDYYKTKTGAEPPLSVMAPLYNTRNFSLVMKTNSNSQDKDAMLNLVEKMEKTFNSKQHRFVNVAKILHSRTIINESPNNAIEQLLYSLQNLELWFQGTEVNKDQVLAHLSLGNAYLKINQLDKSLYHLNTALSISKKIFKDMRNTYVHETLDGLVIGYLKQGAVFEAQNIYNLHKEIFQGSASKSTGLYNRIMEHYNTQEKS